MAVNLEWIEEHLRDVVTGLHKNLKRIEAAPGPLDPMKVDNHIRALYGALIQATAYQRELVALLRKG